jgi:AcrR family transcriptional regulator
MDSRKQQILNAAKVHFNRLGFTKTSVDDIASTLGMTKSSLYYYFKNKEEIFFAAFRDEWENNLDKFEEEASKKSSPSEQILAYTEETLRYHEETVLQHKIPIKTVVETRNLFREFVNQVNEKRLHFYTDNIDRGIKEGFYNECDSDKIAKALIGVKFALQYDGYTKFMNREVNQEDFRKLERNVMFAIELMLLGITHQA